MSIKREELFINNIILKKGKINLVKSPTGTLNARFIYDYFSPPADTTIDTTATKWKFSVKNIKLTNSSFSYNDKTIPADTSGGLDFAHLNLNNIELKISGIDIKNDTLYTKIDKFNFIEKKSNFCLNKLTAIAEMTPTGVSLKNLTIKIPNSELIAEISISYQSKDDLKDFINKPSVNIALKKCKINSESLAYFVPVLKGTNFGVSIAGDIFGKISDLRAKNLYLSYGRATHFKGNLKLIGLPDVHRVFARIDVNELLTTKTDIESIRVGKFALKDKLPHVFTNPSITHLKFTGNVTSSFNDFVVYSNLYTDIGHISTDLSLKYDTSTKNASWRGSLSVKNFQLGDFFADTTFGNISLETRVNGNISQWQFDNLNLHLHGTISSLFFNDYEYNNINLQGEFQRKKFDGTIESRDENLFLKLIAKADFSRSTPDYPKITIQIPVLMAQPYKLNLYKQDSLAFLSTSITLSTCGSNLNNISGEITQKNTSFTKSRETHKIENITITTSNPNDSIKNIRISSDAIDADITGQFAFTELPYAFKKLLNNYISSILEARFSADTAFTTLSVSPIRPFSVLDTENRRNGEPQMSGVNFTFHADIKNINPLIAIFSPDIKIQPNTIISGLFNSNKNIIELHIESPSIIAFGNNFEQLLVNVNTAEQERTLTLKTDCKNISHSTKEDKLSLENFNITAKFRRDSILFRINWDNNDFINQRNAGNISGIISLQNLSTEDKFPPTAVDAGSGLIFIEFLPSNIIIANTSWNLPADNKILIKPKSIIIENFKLMNDEQVIALNGTISDNVDDNLKLIVKNFDLSYFNLINQKAKITLGGEIDGEITISNIKQKPYFVSKININGLIVNNDDLGNFGLNTSWNSENEVVGVNAYMLRGEIKTLMVNGLYYPNHIKDNLDFTLTADKFKLNLLQPYLKTFLSDVTGKASGKVKLTGNFKDPVLTGKLEIFKGGFNVNYLNTRYTFTDFITLSSDAIIFDSIVVNDLKENEVIVNGKLLHNNFKDFYIDLNIKADQPVHFLNTTQQSPSAGRFYGNVFATGNLHIHGPHNDLTFDIKAKTEKLYNKLTKKIEYTEFMIPLTSEEEIYENLFIRFVRHTQDTLVASRPIQQLTNKKTSVVQLNFDLEVTPDAEIQLIFDEKVGDIMKVKGTGNLKMNVTTSGDFNIFGDYIVEEGEYLFTLQNLINKKFSIEKGGKITWNGDVYEGILDMNAIYKLRTAPYELVMKTPDSANVLKARIPVDCVMKIQDRLMSPAIKFDLNFHDLDENTKILIKKYIPTDEEMNKQIFSLLVLNKFIPYDPGGSASPTSDYTSTAGAGVSATTSELLSNQLSNWLSQIDDDFSIGFNYRPGDEITNDQLEVALSTQLFNDRLIINGNVGTSENQQTSSIVGDVQIEYKISKDGKVRIRAFNRSNTYTIAQDEAIYTQGAGLFYREEFNTLKELLYAYLQKLDIKIPQKK